MDNKEIRGTVRTKTDEFIIKDPTASRIIKEALKENGYDVEVELTFSNDGYITNEKLRIFKIS